MDCLFELAKGSHKQVASEMFRQICFAKDLLSKKSFFQSIFNLCRLYFSHKAVADTLTSGVLFIKHLFIQPNWPIEITKSKI